MVTFFKSYRLLVLILIFSFGVQSSFANYISTGMMMPTQNAMSGISMSADMDCPHMKMAQADTQAVDTAPSHQNCLPNCQFCMAAAFILPVQILDLPTVEVLVPARHVIQKPAAIHHMPAHEPPRFYAFSA